MNEPLRIGVAGLGRAFTLMLPTFLADGRVALVAAADPRPEARARFAAEFGGRSYDSVDAMVRDAAVEVVYVATPHEHHAEHACLAARAGRHVLVEKPMAITLADCDAMIEAAHSAHVHLQVGPSHSYDAPIRRTRELIASGAHGAARMITAHYFTDFLYRPRRPEELDTSRGGGVLLSQGAHQVDIVRLLAGGRARSVRAVTCAWDPQRPTEGAYSALLTFDDGVVATLVYSGYGHFDGNVLCNGITELGRPADAGARAWRSAPPAGDEAAQKRARSYGGNAFALPAQGAHFHEHFGFVLASCERADLHALPDAVMVHGGAAAWREPLPPPRVPRVEVIDELVAAVRDGIPPQHDGPWSRATLEVCLAMRESSRARRDVQLVLQVPLREASG